MIGLIDRGRADFDGSSSLTEGRGISVKILAYLIPLLLAGPVTIATGQDVTGRDDGVSTCSSLSSASRTRVACGEEERTVLRVEREVTIFREASELKSRQCATEISVEYFQRNTIARVNGVIDNTTCAASNGQYEIEARVEHANGETETLVFSESWQRDDERPVEFTADYPIGENVELTRLRSRGLRCTCSDAIEE